MSTNLKINYESGVSMVMSCSIVSAWVLNGNREGRDKGDC